MAALMSSLASVFNSCSTLFTVDIYKKIRPEASEKRLVNVGRIATTVVVLLGIAWVPIIEKLADGALYQYLQNVQSYIAPPITAVFLLGIFSNRITNKGALTTLFSGIVIAAIRLTLEVSKDSLATDSIFFHIADMNFLKFSSFFFLYCVAVAILVSMFTKKAPAAQLAGITMQTLSKEDKAANRESYGWVDIVASLFIILMVVFVMVYFS
jgi:SSS family solute:Na+ symporter